MTVISQEPLNLTLLRVSRSSFVRAAISILGRGSHPGGIADRMREALRLSAFETAHTTTSMLSQMLNAAVGLMLLGACLLKPNQGGHAAYILFLVRVIWLWRWRKRSRDSL